MNDDALASESITLPADDGFPIAARVFRPSGTPRATVLVAGGTGIPQRFYARYAARLAARGLLALTFDYPGVGASRAPRMPPRGGMQAWARDADRMLRAARERGAGPLVHVGHSFGGQALGIMPSAPELVDAAVLIAAQSGWYGHWPLPARLRMAALWYGVVPPIVRALGHLPGWAGIGEDLPGDVALEWAAWCRTPGYLTRVVPRDRLCFARFRIPLLAFAFTDDDYAPGRSIDELLSWFARADVEKRVRAPEAIGARSIGHLGFFRSASAALWDESIAWIERSLGDTTAAATPLAG